MQTTASSRFRSLPLLLLVPLATRLLLSGSTKHRATRTPEYTFKIIHTYPHDPGAFTQGLAFRDGFLYEGTIARLNELEYVEGELFANVWQSDRIARISPETGKVTGWIDLQGLLSPVYKLEPGAVLNGIAYDPVEKRLFVTGKLWPSLFEIRLVPRPAPSHGRTPA
jgi:glutamine cyclotransferase